MSITSKSSKPLEKIRRNPKNDWSIDDVEALCREHDVTCRKPSGSSHYTLSHPSQDQLLTIPFKR